MSGVHHFPKEFAKLLKKATKRDIVAIRSDLGKLEAIGVASVDIKAIQSAKPLKEVRIHADSEYRIFFTIEETDLNYWSYCKKTSEAAQNAAINRARERWKRFNVAD